MRDYSDIMHLSRPVPMRPRMELSNRAKIFAPFDALRGFNLAVMVKEQEKGFQPRPELTEDMQERISRQLTEMRAGDEIKITYFKVERRIGDFEIGSILTTCGDFEEIDEYSRTLVLSTCFVLIPDILDIESWEGDTGAE